MRYEPHNLKSGGSFHKGLFVYVDSKFTIVPRIVHE